MDGEVPGDTTALAPMDIRSPQLSYLPGSWTVPAESAALPSQVTGWERDRWTAVSDSSQLPIKYLFFIPPLSPFIFWKRESIKN